LIFGSILVGIILGIMLAPHYNEHATPTYYYAQAAEVEVLKAETPVFIGSKESNFVIKYNWSEEKIIEKIKETFPEQADLMVAIARCESHLQIEMEGPTDDHGLFQIHAPTWDDLANELGHGEYRTNPYHNLAMARHIYDTQGINAWVCYTKNLY
jgi:hypothetical protein